MAITRYAGDRFTTNTSDTKPTGVLDGAYLIDTGNLTQFVRRTVGGTSQWSQLAGGGGGGGIPGGANTQVQFNNAGSFAGDADLTFTDGNRLNVNKLGISGNIYDSNNSLGEGGMVLTNEGTTGVQWKNIESVLSGVGGSGVANYVARWSDEDTITSGVIQDDGTAVGINQAADPDNALAIKSIANNTNPLQIAAHDGDSLLVFRQTAGDGRLSIKKDGGVETIRLDSDNVSYITGGNFGIGTNTPDDKLHIVGDNGDQLKLDNDGDQWTQLNFANNDTNKTFIALDYTNHIFVLGAQGGYSDLDYISFRPDGTNDDMVIQRDGNVGIGNAAPSFKLQVNGTVRINSGDSFLDDGQSIRWGGTAAKIDGSSGGDYLRFYTDGAERMRVISGGNVGIGTDSPNAKLKAITSSTDVAIFQSTHATTTNFYISNSNATANNTANLYFGPANGVNGALIQAIAIEDFSTSANRTADLAFQTRKDGTMSEKMRILADGNVGIGTSPSSLLHVYGADPVLTIQDSESTVASASAILRIGESDGSANLNNNFNIKFVGTASGGDLDISRYNSTTLANQGIRIKHDGNVGIGTVTPAVPLHITKSAVGDNEIPEVIRLSTLNSASPNWSTTDGLCIGAEMKKANGTTITKQPIRFRYDGGNMATTFEAGNVGIGTDQPLNLLMINGSSPIIRFRDSNASGTPLAYIDASDGALKLQADASDETASSFLTLEVDGSEHVRVIADGNVGIGTDAPSELLEVKGNMTLRGATNLRYKIANDSNNNWAEIGNDGATGENTLEFFTGSSSVPSMSITNSKLVGIGTATPVYTLQGNGTNGGIIGVTRTSGNTTGTLGHVRFGNTDVDSDLANIKGVQDGATDSARLEFETQATGAAAATRMTIKSTGLIGIGTADPKALTHIGKFSGGSGAAQEVLRLTADYTALLSGPQIVFTNQHDSGTTPNTGEYNLAGIYAYDDDQSWGGGLRLQTSAGTGTGGSALLDRITIRANGLVGIGITTPDSMLEIAGGGYNSSLKIKGSGGDTGIQFEDSAGNTDGYIYSEGTSIGFLDAGGSWMIQCKNDDFIRFSVTSDTERMRINSAGKVLINDTATTNNNNAQLYVNGPVYGSEFDLPSSGQLDWGNGDARIVEGLTTNYSLSLQNYDGSSAMVTTMFLKNDGNVGVGTVSPAAHLHVSKAVGTTTVLTQVAANSTVGFEIKKTGSTTQHWKIVDGQTINGTLEFYDATDSATRMAINGNGSVGIGTAAPFRNTHIYQAPDSDNFEGALQVGGTSAAVGGYFGYNSTSSGRLTISSLNNSGGANAKIFLGFGLDGDGSPATEVMTLTQGGNVGIGTNNPQGQFQLHSTASAVQRLVLSNTNANLNPQQRIEFWESAATSTSTNAHAAIEYVGDGTYESSDGTLLIKGYGSSADLPIAGFNRNGNVYLGMSGTKRVGINTLTPVKDIDLKYSSNNSADLAGSGLAGGAAGNGILINNTATNVSSYANLDFRANNADGRIAYRYDAANQGSFHFITDNDSAGFVNAMSIMADGKVGIGTDDPKSKLDIGGSFSDAATDLNATNAIAIKQASTDSRYGIYLERAGERRGYYIGMGGPVDSLTFERNNVGTKSDVMSLTRDGSVGIGTNNPAKLLELYSTSHVEMILNTTSNASNCGIDFDLSGTRKGIIRYDHNATDASAKFEFYAGGDTSTPKMVLMGSGNVGIGTNGPETKLHVEGSSFVGSSIKMERSGSGQDEDAGLIFSKSSTATDGHRLGGIYFGHSGTNYAMIRGEMSGSAGGRLYIVTASQTNPLSNTSTETVVIEEGTMTFDGALRPRVDSSYTLGASSLKWSELYVDKIKDASNSTGSANQILSAGGSGGSLDWVSLSEITGVDGSGTADTIPRWTDSDTIGNSLITVPSNNRVQVNGNHTSPFEAIGQSAAGISYSQFVNSSTSAVGNGVGLELRALTSTQERQLSFITSRWLDNTDASRKSRLIITTQDGGTGYNTYQAFGKDPILAADAGNVGIGTTNAVYNVHAQTTSASFTHNIKLNKSSNGGDYAEIAFQLWSGAGTGTNTFGGSGTSRPSVVLRALNESTSSAAGALVVGTFTGGATNSTLTEKFRIASNGSVGIGTNAPDSLLMVYKSGADSIIHVRGASNGGDARVRINGYNSSELYLDRNGVGRFAFRRTTGTDDLSLLKLNDNYTDNSTIMFWDYSSGNVGIGTNNPGARLHVYLAGSAGSFSNIGLFRAGPDSNDSGAEIFVGQQGNSRGLVIRGGRGTGDQALAHFYLNQSGGTIPSTTQDHVMTFLQGGSVGIGTTDPALPLQVSDTGFGQLRLTRDATDDRHWDFLVATNGYLSIRPNNTINTSNEYISIRDSGNNEKIRLATADDSFFVGGSVGIGTNGPSNRLHIEGTTLSNASIRIEKTTTGINEDPGLVLAAANNTDGHRIGSIFFQGGATSYAQIRAEMNGTAGAKIYFVAGSQTNPVSNSSTKTLEIEDGIITAATTIRPLTDSSYTLGQASLKWSELYVDKIKDVNNNTGSANQVLSAGGSGGSLDWISLSDISGVDGSGTANKVAKWTDSDTIGNSQITDNGTSVGINQGAPNAANKLEVSGTVTCSSQLISAQGYTQPPVGTLTIQGPTNGGTTINSDVWGLVIGPQHTRSSTANTYYAGIAFNHLLNHNGSATYNNAPQAWIGTRLHDTSGSERGFLVFATKSGTGTAASDVPVERMCIDPAAGHVGIGTTDPQGKLDINTEAAEATHVYINGEVNQDKLLYFRHYANSEGAGANGYVGYIGSKGNDNLLSLGHLNSSGADVPIMHLAEDGHVGIGTTDPAQILDVYETGSNLGIFRSTATNYARLVIRSGSAGDAQLAFQNNTSTKWSIGNDGGDSNKFKIAVGSGAFAASEAVIVDTSGNLSILGTFTEASSLALKENIEDFTPSLDIINKIRPVKYNKKKESKKEIGLIAEELAELFPELVDRDNEGNPSGVNYSRAVTVLLGGFKELYKEIEELKKRI